MEKINEEIQKDNNEEQKSSNIGVTVLFVILGVLISFVVLLCMQ